MQKLIERSIFAAIFLALIASIFPSVESFAVGVINNADVYNDPISIMLFWSSGGGVQSAAIFNPPITGTGTVTSGSCTASGGATCNTSGSTSSVIKTNISADAAGAAASAVSGIPPASSSVSGLMQADGTTITCTASGVCSSMTSGGTVMNVSIANANGFAGTVANSGTNPSITMQTTVTGIVKGNGTLQSAAVAGTDYTTPANIAASYVPITQTVAGHALNAPVSIACGDLSNSGTACQATAPSGAIVGTTDTQALTHKDLTGTGNTFPTFNQNTSGSAGSISGTLNNVPAPVSSYSFGGQKITNLADGVLTTDAATVGQILPGAIPLNPISEDNFVEDDLLIPPITPVDGAAYIAAAGASAGWTAGHEYVYAAATTSWIDILGRAVTIGDRIGVTFDPSAPTAAGSFSGKGNYVAQFTNATPGSYAYAFTAPVAGYSVLVNGANTPSLGESYEYSSNSSTWVQIALPSDTFAGAGLSRTGAVLNTVVDNSTIDVNGSNQLEVKTGGLPDTKLATQAAVTFLANSTSGTASPSAASNVGAVCAGTGVCYADATGTSDALAVSIPSILTLSDGVTIGVGANASNTTTTPTLAVNGGTAHTIVKGNAAALAVGDIPGGSAQQLFQYSATNTNWTLINPATTASGGSVNSVTCGSGLTGGTITTTGTCAVDAANPTAWTGSVDNSGASSTKAFKAGLTSALPGTCSVGMEYFETDATAGSNIQLCTATNTWTAVSGSGGSFTWNNVTGTSQSAAVSNGYVTNNSSLVTVTLPSTCTVGQIVSIQGAGAGGWKLAQNASQLVNYGTQVTTTGTGGYIASQNQYDSLSVMCIVTNTTWVVNTSTGVQTIN